MSQNSAKKNYFWFPISHASVINNYLVVDFWLVNNWEKLICVTLILSTRSVIFWIAFSVLIIHLVNRINVRFDFFSEQVTNGICSNFRDFCEIFLRSALSTYGNWLAAFSSHCRLWSQFTGSAPLERPLNSWAIPRSRHFFIGIDPRFFAPQRNR